MAFNASKLTFTMMCQDNTARAYPKVFELNPAHPDVVNLATIATAAGKANLDAIAARWAAVSQTKVLSYNIKQEYLNDAAGDGAGDWHDIASISTQLATVGKKATVRIQAPELAIFVGDGAFGPESETVDPADAALLSFLELYQESQGATGDPAGTLLISDGEEMSDTPAPKGRKI